METVDSLIRNRFINNISSIVITNHGGVYFACPSAASSSMASANELSHASVTGLPEELLAVSASEYEPQSGP